MFFDEPANLDAQKGIHKKIWNAQIPVAIFCSTSTVKIFSGYTINKVSHFLTLAKELTFSTENEIDEYSPFSFWDITSQDFWKNHGQHFDGKKLSKELFDNLEFFADRLRYTHNIPFATKLVLRLIFIRYLVDRGVDLGHKGFSSDVEASQEALLALFSDKSCLYALFNHLKDRFNGNLFEIEGKEWEHITDLSLEDMHDFLSAKIDSKRRQPSLFDLYDFAIIPVELISSIFEVLLEEQGRVRDNAYYTPKYLVDYILDMTIDEHIRQNDTCKILDPSCGSGAFLVDSYRRMVEKKLNGKQYVDDDNNELLYNILTENIYGVDLNGRAIDVAIFSLYIAMLDYKNPKELKNFTLPNLKGQNLIECDFFDVDHVGLALLQTKSFDFILGNPPWGKKHGKHVDYCKNNGYMHLMQNNDTCRAFILRSKDFCDKNKNTRCCFVLKSKILYMQGSQSINFRKYLLANTKITSLIELSSVRKRVFEKATAPAIILSYSFSEESAQKNRFEYISMKKNEFFLLFKIIVVEKTDVKYVEQNMLIENDWAWKTLVYGLTGDFDVICRLKTTQKTLQESISKQQPSIVKGTGVKCRDGDMKDASHLVDRLLLDPDTAIDHFVLHESHTTYFVKKRIDRPRSEALFSAPYCLVKRGLDMNDYTMRAVYSERDFVFHETIYAIKGEVCQKTFLLNIVGLLNSKVYSYFNLMLGTSLGIEREARQMQEVLSFPFIFEEGIASQVEQIQEIQKSSGNFGVATDASAEIDALNQAIIKAFGLSKNEFVDYALRIQIPQLTGKNNLDATRKVDMQDFEIYAQYFFNYLRPIFEYTLKYVQISIYPIVAKHFSAVEISILDEKPLDDYIISDDKTHRLKEMLTKLSSHKVNEQFYFLKDVLHFEENSVCIIKPNRYKNWHPAIARLDIMEVTDLILSSETGGKE